MVEIKEENTWIFISGIFLCKYS